MEELSDYKKLLENEIREKENNLLKSNFLIHLHINL